jgi:hypothetical protein
MAKKDSAPAWHELCELRADVREGTISLDQFAADLNSVRTQTAPLVYRDAEAFFARTYPTFNMKRLAGDVLQRLAGRGGKPVIRIQVAYGGGKTHTLITLLHLAERGNDHAAHATVREFVAAAGLHDAPRARVALLPFDQFDVHEGLVVYGPSGDTRRVRTPWGALAYQLAGDAGFARLAAHEDGFNAPAEPLLVDLLRAPQAEGLGSLVLVDETLWYCRQAVLADRTRMGVLKDFFHSLTQAVTKVPQAALVATLISSRVEAHDDTGLQVLAMLEGEFERVEEVVEPVGKEDVAEVLRRRLFDRVPGEADRRRAVDAVFARMHELPLRDGQRSQAAYDRLVRSYPFHADFIDVLYHKWTLLPKFQRTRGALRLLALGLRDAAGQDGAILIGPGVLLPRIGDPPAPTPALRELVNCAEESDTWVPILSGELEKARQVQDKYAVLRARRDVERAVLATFLHSQPQGQKAEPWDVIGMLAEPSTDPAGIEEGLKEWRARSWYLVESPTSFRLGTSPNLTHMHVQAMASLSVSAVEDELERRIRDARLVDADAGVVPHNLPKAPRDVNDSAEIHFVVLRPEHAVPLGGAVPADVKAFFDTTTGPKNPRTYRNAIVALAPDVARLGGLREQVRRLLGWEAVEKGELAALFTPELKKELKRRKQDVEVGIADAVRATYAALVSVDEDGEPQTQALPAGATRPFDRVKALLVQEERLLDGTLDPELLLPVSDLELWGPDERKKRARDLLAAFYQFPRMPRLLHPERLRDTLARAVREGAVVLELARADGSTRSFWRTAPSPEELGRPELEVVPVPFARLHDLAADLLAPGRVEGLWPAPGEPLSVSAVERFFDGTRAPLLAGPQVLDRAVREAVRHGVLEARVGGTSYLRQEMPDHPLAPDLHLLTPPPPVRGSDIGPKALPEAWDEGADAHTTTGRRIADALAARRGGALPWVLVQDAVHDALAQRLIEKGAGDWPCTAADAERVTFRIPETVVVRAEEIAPKALPAAWTGGRSTVAAIKTALETARGRTIPDDALRKALRDALQRGWLVLDGATALPEGPSFRDARLRIPPRTLYTEAQLTATQVQDFADAVVKLKQAAPGLDFHFRVVVTAEGDAPDRDVTAKISALLGDVKSGWAFETERDAE